MAEFKVETNQLQNYASQISALQRELDSVAVRLGAMQLGSVLQIKASTALIGKIADCKWAAAHQSDDLGRLAAGLSDIAELYNNCEKNLSDPKTQAQADAQARQDAIDDAFDWLEGIGDTLWGFTGELVDILGEGCVPISILSALFGFVNGGGENISNAIQDLISDGGNVIKALFDTTEGGINANWMEELLGLNVPGINSWDDAVDDWINSVDFGAQTTTAGKAAVVCKWAGYAMSYITSGFQNYGEFDGDLTNARFWGETVIQGTVDVGLGIAAGIAAAALLPATAPAILIGAVGAGVVWAANEVCEWITGGDNIGEVVANAVCDGVEATVEFVQDVGETIADGVETAWNGVCDWVGSWW